jgi:hypothetical protein
MRSVRSILVVVSLAAIVVTGCSTNRGGAGPAQAPASDSPSTETTGAQGTGQGTGSGPATASPAGTSSGSLRTRAEVDSAIATATSFLRREVGMTTPVASNFRWTGKRTAKLDVRSRIVDAGGRANMSQVTVVSLERLSKVWYVTGTSTKTIVVSRPGPLDRIASPVRVSGKALAFEGNVRVTVTEDRYGKDVVLGAGNVLGRGDEIGPFAGSISFRRPAGSTGSIIFTEPSAIDGTPVNATVVRVRFAKAGASPLANRISDPKVAADRLVAAWVAADRAAAANVATKAVVARLFSADRSGEDPKPGSCRLVKPAQFICSYPLSADTDLSLVVEGGASAGYLVTGFEFAD